MPNPTSWRPTQRSTDSSSTAGSPPRRSEPTAPTCGRSRPGSSSASLTLDDVDARVLADYVDRPRPWTATGLRPRRSRAGSRRFAPASASRSAPRESRTPRSRPRRPRRLPEAPKATEIEALLELVEGSSPLALRNRALLELLYSGGLRSAEAVALDLATSTSSARRFTCAGRAARSAPSRSARRPPTTSPAISATARPELARQARGRVLPLRPRAAARHEHGPPARAQPASAAARLRDASPRGRRRPADDPGAARALLAVDDPGLQPRRRPPASPRLRPLAPPLVGQERAPRRRIGHGPVSTPDTDVERFLLYLAARRSPRTVDAYRRDLAALEAFRDGSAGDATVDELERWVAEMRAAGLAPSTIARRTSAARSYFRHLGLIGARADNPAAALVLPKRGRRIPRALSPGETERLIDAATGTTPRSLRDRALVELLYGAGLRVSEAVGLEKGGVDIEERIVRVVGKGGKERLVPLGRPAAEAVAALPRARPAAPRPALPPRALPERPRRPAHAGGSLPHPPPARREGRPRAGAGPPSPAAPLLRDPPPRGRGRPTKRPGDARPRRPGHDGALHARLGSPEARGLLRRAPSRAAKDAPRILNRASIRALRASLREHVVQREGGQIPEVSDPQVRERRRRPPRREQ